MELYEASQLSIEGEDLLDEIGDYSSQLLNSCMPRVHYSQAKIVQNTLDHPHHKSLARFMAQNLSRDAHMTNNENWWIKELQELAIFEFKMVQSKYQEEILQISRWDVNATEKLPNYMKICFEALDNITNEIANKIYQTHGRNPVESLRKTWKNLCKAFLVEARWFNCGEVPSCEEYLKNGIVSSGAHVVLVHVFYLLGQGLTPKDVEFIDNNPTIISSTATILRLWDDLGSDKDEGQDGNDGSYVEYYMKENAGCSIENARRHVTKMISDAWKMLNQECLFQDQFSPNFNKSCLNLTRMVPLMYSYDDHQRLPLLEHHVKSLLTVAELES